MFAKFASSVLSKTGRGALDGANTGQSDGEGNLDPEPEKKEASRRNVAVVVRCDTRVPK